MSLAHNAAPTCRQCTALLPVGSSACTMCGLQAGGTGGHAVPPPGPAPHVSGPHQAGPYQPGPQYSAPQFATAPQDGAPQFATAPQYGAPQYGGPQFAAAPPYGQPVAMVAAKSTGIAVLLTFLWPGAGSLYAGSIGVGIGIMIFDFVLWLLALTGIGLIIAVPVWLVTFAIAAVLATGQVSAFNQRNGIVVR